MKSEDVKVGMRVVVSDGYIASDYNRQRGRKGTVLSKANKVVSVAFDDGTTGHTMFAVELEPISEPTGGDLLYDASAGSYSRATTTNPKDLLGNKKISITKLPMVGIIHGAHAMMDGADKYGPYNWRAKDVIASIYVDAAMRHFAAWFEREETAEDSGVHHLGHAIACAAILLDALENGNLIDDRPTSNHEEVVKDLFARLTKVIETKRAEKAAKENK